MTDYIVHADGADSNNRKWWVNLSELPDEALELLTIARQRDLRRLNVVALQRDLTPEEEITRSVINEVRADILRVRSQRADGQATAPEMSEARVAILLTRAHVSLEGAIAARTEERLRRRKAGQSA